MHTNTRTIENNHIPMLADAKRLIDLSFYLDLKEIGQDIFHILSFIQDYVIGKGLIRENDFELKEAQKFLADLERALDRGRIERENGNSLILKNGSDSFNVLPLLQFLQEYKGTLNNRFLHIQELLRTGLTAENITSFVRLAETVDIFNITLNGIIPKSLLP